jgi:hypothetical protein
MDQGIEASSFWRNPGACDSPPGYAAPIFLKDRTPFADLDEGDDVEALASAIQ